MRQNFLECLIFTGANSVRLGISFTSQERARHVHQYLIAELASVIGLHPHYKGKVSAGRLARRICTLEDRSVAINIPPELTNFINDSVYLSCLMARSGQQFSQLLQSEGFSSLAVDAFSGAASCSASFIFNESSQALEVGGIIRSGIGLIISQYFCGSAENAIRCATNKVVSQTSSRVEIHLGGDMVSFMPNIIKQAAPLIKGAVHTRAA